MVSDMFMCLFETEIWSNNLTLVFWSNLRSLITIRKGVIGNIMKFIWKQKGRRNTNYLMEIELDNTKDVLSLIIEKMEKFGINYKMSKQNVGPKTGQLPEIDIDSVEKAIAEIEPKIGHIIQQVEVEHLMDLYSKVRKN